METASRYRSADLITEALRMELKIFAMLGKAVAGVAIFIFVQFMYVIRETAALVVDALGLFLGFEIGTIVGVRAADD